MKFQDFDLREPQGWGPIGSEMGKLVRAVRALFPVDTHNVTANVLPDGTRYTAKGAGGGSGFPLRRCTVVTVNADTLTCTIDGGATTFTVHKPVDLRVSGYVAFDDTILDAFESANTWPWSVPTDYAEYTQPNLMKAGSGVLSDTRAVQQRYRLVYASSYTSSPALPGGNLRRVIHEMVWPHYYASGGSAAGGVPGSGFASTLYEVWAARDQNGEWMEVLPHRAWKDVHEVLGEPLTYDGTNIGRVTGTGIAAPGIAPR